MDGLSLAFSVAQTVFAALQCSELKHLFSKFSYESELVKLEQTVKAIESVLRDADTKRELNEQEQHFVNRLSNAIYDADDLVDELNTLVGEEMMQRRESAAGLFSKVHNFVSRLDDWSCAYDMSREVKQLRETLDGIASDASKFCFKVNNQPIRQRREATCSYVYQGDIIGREEDTTRVVEILLDPNVEGHIPVLTIVGMGGLGKTALAQLVFGDGRIKTEFPLRLWACVSDEGQPQLNVDSVLGSILKSANTDETHIDNLVREQLQIKLREKLEGKKYMLVLDDVWTENHGEWLKLEGFLKGGQGGSRIVVTTRSKDTAIAVGSKGKLIHELSGLSNGNSWRLFEAIVGQEQANRTDLVGIGREIVEKCANVPLAIKVIGSLLYGQEKSKWQSFQKNRLCEIQKGKNDIMHILKFSYHHLTPSLKSCFSFCAIFPKDFVIWREMLISLWMAQGYVEPLDGARSIEDAAAENFMILVRRCFFQDVVKDQHGEIVSCKIHDLMHDVAQAVTKNEICTTNPNLTTMSNLDAKIRHISRAPRNCTESFFTKSKIRTYLHCDFWNSKESIQHFPISKLLANLVCLRALDLSHLNLRSLPDTVGGLLHLRYLDLSGNTELEVLAKSITKLHYLQTLILLYCPKLRELPKDLSKLVDLGVLDIEEYNALRDMPADMGKLTCLWKLSVFLVGGRNSSSEPVADIGELGPLKNLKGSLRIKIGKYYRSGMEKRGEGNGYLSNKEHLRDIHIVWPSYGYGNNGSIEDQEALLEVMQPHRNLSVFKLWSYPGERIPRWGREDKFATCLPNLVEIELNQCKGLQELPWLSKLRFLKRLELDKLENLEYMENNSSTSNRTIYYGGAARGEIESSSSSSSSSVVFFPSLEELTLNDLLKLKGWWRVADDQAVVGNESCIIKRAGPVLPLFPRLSKLNLNNCPELTSIPPCSNLECLNLDRVNVMLRIKEEEKLGGEVEVSVDEGSSSAAATGDSRYQKHDGDDPKLRRVFVTEVGYLKCMPLRAFRCLREMRISESYSESLSEIEDVFRSCLSSLRSLDISHCSKLTSVSVLEHLTALEQLTMWGLPELSFDEDDMPWISFGQSLRELKLDGFTKMVKLPKGMRHLTALEILQLGYLDELRWVEDEPWISLGQSLRSLYLESLPKMEKLPKAMRQLTSLHSLKISNCPELKELPEWIGDGCFSSLRSLEIWGCRKMESLSDAMGNLTSLTTLSMYGCPPILEQRCTSPDGEDWPKIQHIPNIHLSTLQIPPPPPLPPPPPFF